MPDLKAGSKVDDLDTTPTTSEYVDDFYDFTNTAGYGVTTSGGTYSDCGVAFLAPTSGRVMLFYRAQIANSASWSAMSPAVRTGGTVGSGTSVLAAAEATALIGSVATPQAASMHKLVEGLTPGSTYNVRMEHRVGGGTGSLGRRSITVVAVP